MVRIGQKETDDARSTGGTVELHSIETPSPSSSKGSGGGATAKRGRSSHGGGVGGGPRVGVDGGVAYSLPPKKANGDAPASLPRRDDNPPVVGVMRALQPGPRPSHTLSPPIP